MKEFKVFAISKNRNSFGLKGVCLMARDGESWEVSANDLNIPALYSILEVPASGGCVDWCGFGFEIPQQKPDAPAALLRMVWGDQAVIREETPKPKPRNLTPLEIRQELVKLVQEVDLGYNEKGKVKFRELAEAVAIQVATELVINGARFEITWNPGGVAASGDLHLHLDHLDVLFSQGFLDGKFMYRGKRHLKDYTGFYNRWLKWDRLVDDFDGCLSAFREAIKDARARVVEAEAKV